MCDPPETSPSQRAMHGQLDRGGRGTTTFSTTFSAPPSVEQVGFGGGTACLVLLALLLALAFGGLGADLLVVLLEGGEVFTGLGELALLHALADVPVHESALGVHEV